MKLADWLDRLSRALRGSDSAAEAATADGPSTEPGAVSQDAQFPDAAPGFDEDQSPSTDFDDVMHQRYVDEENTWKEPISNWTGNSVRELPSGRDFHEDHGHLLNAPHLISTVPEEYRGVIYEADREVADGRSAYNSLAVEQHSMEILAIDHAGDALVRMTVVYHYEDVAVTDYRVLPKEEAFSLVENYRASPDIAKAHVEGFGLLPHNFDYSDDSPPRTGMPPIPAIALISPAEPGATYSGPVQKVTTSTVFQRINADTLIAHNVKQLAGADLTALEGKNVEIRYPFGQVGVVHAIGGLPAPAMDHYVHIKGKDAELGDHER